MVTSNYICNYDMVSSTFNCVNIVSFMCIWIIFVCMLNWW